eukprot:CAMPEP_0181187102 /NCGR_PEP_ID=MMETSP1096-20121128/10385_1 /TAXON_ID=156174 ORGANISM="Chrysochromulina ericina, Strain CCMP281" /NCGR_SAMPLE_ID=MMETSP1096 /ASSEMBLY_ACC=CAM_ASM_000453 /LENGTH=118 /DNA_ID=CAMNT_0023276037 /DNA_START=374 /DNA_END=727 /DNA_ORIENTATION=+
MKSLNASKSPCSGVGASAGGRGARASLGAIGQGGADRGGNPVYDLSPSTLLNREEGDRLKAQCVLWMVEKQQGRYLDDTKRLRDESPNAWQALLPCRSHHPLRVATVRGYPRVTAVSG